VPELPKLAGKKVILILERLGFAQVRQRGSHVILKRATPEEQLLKANGVTYCRCIGRSSQAPCREYCVRLVLLMMSFLER